MKKVVRLEVIKNERKRQIARDVRSDLFKSARGMCCDAGDTLAGFAILVWDEKGNTATQYRSSYDGPIGRRLLPEHCKNALNQHIAADMAGEYVAMPSPEEPEGA